MYSRRKALSTAGVLAGTLLAGCASETDDETPTPSNDGPGWATWVPLDMYLPDREALYFDAPAIRQGFPEGSTGRLWLGSYATQFGFEATAVTDFVSLTGQEIAEHVVITGDIDSESVLDALGVEEAALDSYEGYQTGTADGLTFAVADSTLVLGPQSKAFVDARQGATDTLADGDSDVSRVLSVIGKSPLATAGGRFPDGELAREPRTGGTAYRPTSGDPRVEFFLLFDTAADAETVVAENEQRLRELVTADNPIDIQSVEQSGRLVIVTGVDGSWGQ